MANGNGEDEPKEVCAVGVCPFHDYVDGRATRAERDATVARVEMRELEHRIMTRLGNIDNAIADHLRILAEILERLPPKRAKKH